MKSRKFLVVLLKSITHVIEKSIPPPSPLAKFECLFHLAWSPGYRVPSRFSEHPVSRRQISFVSPRFTSFPRPITPKVGSSHFYLSSLQGYLCQTLCNSLWLYKELFLTSVQPAAILSPGSHFVTIIGAVYTPMELRMRNAAPKRHWSYRRLRD